MLHTHILLPLADMLRNGSISEGRAKAQIIQDRTSRNCAMGAVHGAKSHCRLMERQSGSAVLRRASQRSKSRHHLDELIVVDLLGQIVGQFAQLLAGGEEGAHRR